MGFGTELQGPQSHEHLISLQQFEVKLLQTVKQCVLHRVKCERQYAQSLADMVNLANRFDNTYNVNTPVYKAWTCVIKETENLATMVKQNADTLCSQTVERLAHLIEEKKTLKSLYTEERRRLDDDFKRAKEEVLRLQSEYQRVMVKLHQDRSKYEDAAAKGKAANKIESAKQKYIQTTERLHNTHNEYVLALKDINLHQKDFSRVLLPGLLDSQQEVQETMVHQCKDILVEFAALTNLSSDKYSKCYGDMSKAVNGVRPSGEYDEFLDKHRSDPTPHPKVEFQEGLLESYTGTLRPNEIIVDELSEKHLQASCAKLNEKLEQLTEKKNSRDTDLQNAETRLQDETAGEDSDRTKYYTQKAQVVHLRREVSEAHSHLEKLRNLVNVVKEPLSTCEGSIPCVDLDGVQVGPPSTSKDNLGDGNDIGAAEGFSQSAKDKFNTITKQMKNKFKNKKAGNDPPKPPSKDFLEKDNASSGDSTPRGGAGDNRASRVRSGTSEGYVDVVSKATTAKKTANNGRAGKKWTIHEAQWFHGVLPRDEVVRLLENDGDYLVRESKNKKTGEPQYVLSVKWQDGKHFIIQGEEGNWRFEGDSFATILDLVNHQHDCGQPVTKKSQAILRKAILREQWELSNDDVTLGVKLGNGNFGDVFKGNYQKEEVAVKTCKETLSDEQKKKFLQEGRILKQYNHPNIVRFIGIAAQRQPVMIVMEYVPGGALLSFLRKMEKSPKQRMTPKQLVKLCVDAAAGMAYLEDKNCIHRDLAARNCLVGKGDVLKISDFGMSREEEEYTVSGGLKQIPIKWTAPEALNFGTYTSACDVWSYGILMWEIFSFGNTPYSGLTNNQAREKVDEGYRMPATEGTPPGAYTVMQECWASEPKDRPKFEKVHADLTALVKGL